MENEGAAHGAELNHGARIALILHFQCSIP